MKKAKIAVKIAVLVLVVVSQVFYVKYVVLRRHHPGLSLSDHRTELPPGYSLITDGESWTWTQPIEGFTNRYQSLQLYANRGGAVASAWRQYEYEGRTNQWVEVKP